MVARRETRQGPSCKLIENNSVYCTSYQIETFDSNQNSKRTICPLILFVLVPRFQRWFSTSFFSSNSHPFVVLRSHFIQHGKPVKINWISFCPTIKKVFKQISEKLMWKMISNISLNSNCLTKDWSISTWYKAKTRRKKMCANKIWLSSRRSLITWYYRSGRIPNGWEERWKENSFDRQRGHQSSWTCEGIFGAGSTKCGA